MQADLPSAFAAAAVSRIDALLRHERPHLEAAGALLADAILAGGLIHGFGTGHSEATTLELAGRAGGLVPTNRLAMRDLVLLGGEPAGSIDPLAERDPGIAQRLLDLYDIASPDVVVIASNSGGNGLIVESAVLLKEKSVPIIAITSLAHSRAITSRHPSGKRLLEVADVVIDNCAPYGDALIPTAHGPVCAVSSITSAMAVQMMVAVAIERLLDAGVVPPTYLSANTPGADAHNQEIEARYAGRLRRGAL